MIEQRTRHPAGKPAIASNLADLSQVDWEEVLDRLLLYTEARLRRALYSRLDARDIVQDAIMSLFTGARRWPEDIDLYAYLVMVINSKISHQLEKEYYRRERRLVSITEQVVDLVGRKTTEEKIDVLSLKNETLKLFEGDELASKVIRLLADDPQVPARDMAAMLEVSISEIYEAKRRLKRTLEKIISSKEESNPTRQSS